MGLNGSWLHHIIAPMLASAFTYFIWTFYVYVLIPSPPLSSDLLFPATLLSALFSFFFFHNFAVPNFPPSLSFLCVIFLGLN